MRHMNDGANRTRGKQVYGDATSLRHLLDGWTVVAQYPGSGGATHTVESDGSGRPQGYRCTCMGYRIVSKKKVEQGLATNQSCKHTEQAQREGLK